MMQRILVSKNLILSAGKEMFRYYKETHLNWNLHLTNQTCIMWCFSKVPVMINEMITLNYA